MSTPADHHVRLCKTGAYRVEKGAPLQGGHAMQGVCDDADANANANPDITYAVCQCARYSSDPKPEHWCAVMRVLRYLKGTPDYGLHYHKHLSSYVDNANDSPRVRMSKIHQPFSYSSHYFPGSANVNLVGYSDADFANSVDDRRSITGYVFLLVGAPLSWNCMTQHTTASSTMESEYYAVCKTTQ